MAKNKDKKTRGQMAEARRMSAQAGVILSREPRTNPGIGAVFPKTGRKLTVSDELARFGAFPNMGGVSARQYENPKPKKKKSK
jgi:hypothetical protein